MAKLTLAQAAKLLGIPENATIVQAKQAFKKLALKYHPDRAPEDQRADAQERFQQINEAFQVFVAHHTAQNTGTGRTTGGQNRPGTGQTNTGNARPNGGASGNARPNAGAGRPNPNSANETLAKVYWERYQDALKTHADFIKREVTPVREQIDRIESLLLQAIRSKELDKRIKYTEELAPLLRRLKYLVAQAGVYADLKDHYLKEYNQVIKNFNKYYD